MLGCKRLIEISIPKRVTKIGRGAFASSGLTHITIPGSVTVIEDSAFVHCRELRSVVIEDGVMKIGRDAFKGCASLAHVRIPASVVVEIDRDAFACYKSILKTDECFDSPALTDVEMLPAQWIKFHHLFPYAEQAKPYINT